jgi:hypothetical protein
MRFKIEILRLNLSVPIAACKTSEFTISSSKSDQTNVVRVSIYLFESNIYGKTWGLQGCEYSYYGFMGVVWHFG